MPPLDSIMYISGPFYIAIIGGVVIVTIVVITILAFRKKQSQNKSLNLQVEALKNELQLTKPQKHDITPIEESYLQFIYNISHEVSNPLQSVQTNLDNMADCSPEEISRRNQYHKIISQEIKRLFTLTENLRTLSRLESIDRQVKRERVNLKSVVENVIIAQGDRASAGRITLEYQGPNQPAIVLGDQGLLYQMILNLVDNSIKYSKDTGGEIIIVVKETNEITQVSVNDNGIGIPKDDLPYIFDTAYRSPSNHSIRKAGSGLGLAIVRRIVEQHGGKIDVKSVVGEGTTIRVELAQYSPAIQA